MNVFTILILLYAFIIPFQWALSPVAGVDLAFIRVATLALILGWLALGLLKKRFIIPLTGGTFFLSAFLFLATLSWFWAGERNFSLRKIIFLWSLLPFFFVLVMAFKQSPKLRERSARFLVGGAFAIACVGIGQFCLQFLVGVGPLFAWWTGVLLPFFLGQNFGQTVATYPSLLVNIGGVTLMRASAFFPDPHIFSLYMGLTLPLSFAFFMRSSGRMRTLWLFVFGTIFLADLLSFSRGGYMGLMAGLIVLAVLFRPQRLWQSKKILLFLFVCCLALVLLMLSPFGSRLLSSFSSADGSTSERLRLWQEAISHIAERPLFGTGLGNYSLLVKPSASYREPIYVHNLFLDITVETGLIGLSLFLGFLVSGFLSALGSWRKTDNVFYLSLVLALAIFSTHALFETPLFSVHVLPAFLLVVAAGV